MKCLLFRVFASSRDSLILAMAVSVAMLLSQPVHAAKFALKKQKDDVRVEIDGKLFTVYLTTTGPKPILWPVIGPPGAEMTRDFPMKVVPDEKHDHPHQRSIWFTHGDVNGVDFWSENEKHGAIAHREYLRLDEGDKEAILATRNDWIDAAGKKVCEDWRMLTFAAGEGWRAIDFEITLTASEAPVKSGDTK